MKVIILMALMAFALIQAGLIERNLQAVLQPVHQRRGRGGRGGRGRGGDESTNTHEEEPTGSSCPSLTCTTNQECLDRFSRHADILAASGLTVVCNIDTAGGATEGTCNIV